MRYCRAVVPGLTVCTVCYSIQSVMYFNYEEDDKLFERSCPNSNYLFHGNVNFAQNLRSPLKNYVDRLCPKAKTG